MVEKMDFNEYIDSLRKAAEYFEKQHPEFPDVVATYKKSADVIETLLIQLCEAESDADKIRQNY